jgi:hypothetical protein
MDGTAEFEVEVGNRLSKSNERNQLHSPFQIISIQIKCVELCDIDKGRSVDSLCVDLIMCL